MQKKHKKEVEKSKLEDTLKKIIEEGKPKEKTDEKINKDKKSEENKEEKTDEDKTKEIPKQTISFNEFAPVSNESSAPVLERVVEERGTRLEQDTNSFSTDEIKEQRNYSVIQDNLDYSTRARNTEASEQKDYEPPVLKPIIGSENLQTQRLFEQENNETMKSRQNINPETIQAELIRETRKLPFEKQEFKYKKIKYKIQ